jgi:ElaB protein
METDIENQLESTIGEEQTNRLKEKTRALTHKAKAAAQCTDDYVHESPWIAVGAAVAAGVLVGLLVGRTR